MAAIDEQRRSRFEEELRQRLVGIYSANPWLIVGDVDQAATRQAADIGDLAAVPVLAVGARTGIGPNPDGIQLISLGLETTGSVSGDMNNAAPALADPGPQVMAAIDAWDPGRQARVIGGLMTVAGLVAERATFGSRPRAWADLEDKLAIEAIWAGAGIPTAPSVQVPVDDGPGLLAAHRRLATAHGAVWAGDNASGSHGGGDGTFWVPDLQAATALQRTLQGPDRRFQRVRVMPFVDGISCSIHGMVIPDRDGTGDEEVEVVTFRPMEMMTLRDAAGHRFVYGRASSHWDPHPTDREAMKATASAIGRELHRRVGYRGTFTVDGVLGVDGFVPTEVNPRYGAALPPLMETLAGQPINLMLLHLALVEGVLPGPPPDRFDAGFFERWVTGNLDRNRLARGFLDVEQKPDRERLATVTRLGDGLTVDEVVAGDGGPPPDAADGTGQRVAEVRWGAARNGGMLLMELGPAIPIGPPTAPLLVEIIEAVDRHWDLGVPPLTAAPSVRPGGPRPRP